MASISEGAVAAAAPWPVASPGAAATTRFDALVPGAYTVCAVASATDVTCRPAIVAAAPTEQTLSLR